MRKIPILHDKVLLKKTKAIFRDIIVNAYVCSWEYGHRYMMR